ncbi:MAG: imidazole glycerol phosphate synthase subunit HisH [Solirubrobacteraceae bacterium]
MNATGSAIRIAVVDYGMGNRRSVQKALEHIGAPATVTRDHDELCAVDGLVVPGVGAFPLAMRNLHELGLAAVLHDCVARGIPVLGICLGMQLLFEDSDELEPAQGLGLLAGRVSRLDSGGLRLPHIGWNEVAFERSSPLLAGLPADGCPFYHVHSLAARPSDPDDVVGIARYGKPFATIVERGLVFGVQFHPEKSSAHGLAMLASFARVCAAQAVTAPRPASGPGAGRDLPMQA